MVYEVMSLLLGSSPPRRVGQQIEYSQVSVQLQIYLVHLIRRELFVEYLCATRDAREIQ